MRGLHWLMAALVLGQLGLGFTMTFGAFDLPTAFTLYQWHKWIGLVVLALWLPRLVARRLTVAPPAVEGWRGRIAGATHAALYVLLLLMPISGWLATSASPLHLPLLVPLPGIGLLRVPDLIAPDAAAYAVLSTMHEVCAYALSALLALHVAAALHHAFVARDDTLRRMIG
ncbi:cytochrome b [Xanthobacter sediminis]